MYANVTLLIFFLISLTFLAIAEKLKTKIFLKIIILRGECTYS